MAGPPSSQPHPPLNLRIHPPKPLRMSSRGLSVHPSLGYDVHNRLWSADANAMSSITETAGSGFPSPTQHLRQPYTHPAHALLSRKESPEPAHGLDRRSGSPAWTHLDDVTQTQARLCRLALKSSQSRRTSVRLRTKRRAHLRTVR